MVMMKMTRTFLKRIDILKMGRRSNKKLVFLANMFKFLWRVEIMLGNEENKFVIFLGTAPLTLPNIIIQ